MLPSTRAARAIVRKSARRSSRRRLSVMASSFGKFATSSSSRRRTAVATKLFTKLSANGDLGKRFKYCPASAMNLSASRAISPATKTSRRRAASSTSPPGIKRRARSKSATARFVSVVVSRIDCTKLLAAKRQIERLRVDVGQKFLGFRLMAEHIGKRAAHQVFIALGEIPAVKDARDDAR